jgi:hypothetical protein
MSASFTTPSLRDHDVLGLDVAVDETLAVGVLERFGDLEITSRAVGFVVPLVLDDVVVDGAAVDVLHDEVVVLARLAHVEGLHDVGVVELPPPIGPRRRTAR